MIQGLTWRLPKALNPQINEKKNITCKTQLQITIIIYAKVNATPTVPTQGLTAWKRIFIIFQL